MRNNLVKFILFNRRLLEFAATVIEADNDGGVLVAGDDVPVRSLFAVAFDGQGLTNRAEAKTRDNITDDDVAVDPPSPRHIAARTGQIGRSHRRRPDPVLLHSKAQGLAWTFLYRKRRQYYG